MVSRSDGYSGTVIQSAGDGAEAARGENQLASIEELESDVLQDLRIQGQVVAGAVDETRQHDVGGGADAGLLSAARSGPFVLLDLVQQQIGQMPSNGPGIVIRRGDLCGAVVLLGDDDSRDFRRVYKDRHHTDAAAR